MTRLFVVRLGDWMFDNWHLFHWESTASPNGKNRRFVWRKIL
jgi:hypothetical protein